MQPGHRIRKFRTHEGPENCYGSDGDFRLLNIDSRFAGLLRTWFSEMRRGVPGWGKFFIYYSGDNGGKGYVYHFGARYLDAVVKLDNG